MYLEMIEIVKKPFNEIINENNLVLIDRYNLDEVSTCLFR